MIVIGFPWKWAEISSIFSASNFPLSHISDTTLPNVINGLPRSALPSSFDAIELTNKYELASFTDLITYVNDRPGHDQRYALNDEKIRTELGWKPTGTFDKKLHSRSAMGWFLLYCFFREIKLLVTGTAYEMPRFYLVQLGIFFMCFIANPRNSCFKTAALSSLRSNLPYHYDILPYLQ